MPCPYLEMLEEGGDAGDLEAQAPGGASGGGESLVLPSGGGGGPRPVGAAAGGRHPEEQGEGHAGRPPHHRSGERRAQGGRAAAGAGVSSLPLGGLVPGCAGDGHLRAAETTQESSIIQLPSPPSSLSPARPGPQPSPAGSGRADAGSGCAIGCAERRRRRAGPVPAGRPGRRGRPEPAPHSRACPAPPEPLRTHRSSPLTGGFPHRSVPLTGACPHAPEQSSHRSLPSRRHLRGTERPRSARSAPAHRRVWRQGRW